MSLKALADKVLSGSKSVPHNRPRGTARGTGKTKENQYDKPFVPLSHSLGMGQVGQAGQPAGQAAVFLNGDPSGNCLICGEMITDADRPNCIPVAGAHGSGPAGYLCPKLECYRRWVRGNG